jgi:hypothetical protein
MRVYGNCNAMGTARGAHNGGEGGPPLRRPPASHVPARFPGSDGVSLLAIFGAGMGGWVGVGEWRGWRGRGHLRCAYVRLSSETAVLEPPSIERRRRRRRRRLLRCPRGSKPAWPAYVCARVCVGGVQAARCRRRCNLPDGYMHCYHAARLPGFYPPAAPRPTSLSSNGDGDKGEGKQEKRLRARFFEFEYQ